MTKKELARKLLDCGVFYEGKVTLRSGKKADFYIDPKRPMRSGGERARI